MLALVQEITFFDCRKEEIHYVFPPAEPVALKVSGRHEEQIWRPEREVEVDRYLNVIFSYKLFESTKI